MAEPLSFVASIIAVATLAESVTGKGYRYMKAVQNCPSEVRSLVAEVNVLCGVLDRLSRLLNSDDSECEVETDTETYKGPNADDGATILLKDFSRIDNNQQARSGRSDVLAPPDFIHECQRVLSKIEVILDEFPRTGAKAEETSNKSNIRRVKPKDLKWPLQKSKTLQLMSQLERLKTTCTLALAESSLSSIYSVLKQTTLSNQCLSDLKQKQQKVLDLAMTADQEEVLMGLSSSDPTYKLKEFRRDRQYGTGTWLFDIDEVQKWVDGSSLTLWIYGIPGAGKTILSTLMIDEVLYRKRSSSVGTAYFYIRHDDNGSHLLTNVLGSLIAQLARQSSSALGDVMDLRAQHPHESKLSAALSDEEMINQLHCISRHFDQIFIMVDGLDECGSTFDSNRKRLLDVLAELHRVEDSMIHALIFSRDEFDIRIRLDMAGFQMVSVAATSADLRLYVNAWLPSLDIRSEKLRTEVVERLVGESKGMFMWVRAQVDYLQRLPNDIEKRKALKELPPTLPDTYIRIFETIDTVYPLQTTMYIQRVLKWLVLGPGVLELDDSYGHTGGNVEPELTVDVLCQAICLENEHDVPSPMVMITPKQILGWLGCLVHVDEDQAAITLSHFTVIEFLTTSPESVSSSIARKYLVGHGDAEYLLATCLTCIMHDTFRQVNHSSTRNIKIFLSEQTFFKYSTICLIRLMWEAIYSGLAIDCGGLLQTFLSLPMHPSLELWDSCSVGLASGLFERGPAPTVSTIKTDFPSPLCFATAIGSADEVRRILDSGTDPDIPSLRQGHRTSLHLAIYTGSQYGAIAAPEADYIGCSCEDIRTDDSIDNYNTNKRNRMSVRQERGLEVIKNLIEYGADVNRQAIVYIEDISDNCENSISLVTPLTLAMYCHFWQAVEFLLEMDATWDAIEAYDGRLNGVDMKCSMERLLVEIPRFQSLLYSVTDASRYPCLDKAFEEWRVRNQISQQLDLGDNTKTSQKEFVDAYQKRDWVAVRDLLMSQPSIEVNCLDDDGFSALHHSAAEGEREVLASLLQAGANPNFLTSQGWTALLTAVHYGLLENAALLISHGADLEYRSPDGYTALLEAVYIGQDRTAKFLLDKGAKADAVADGGSGALHIAIEQRDSNMFSLLLSNGVDPFLPDDYGSTPLHEACMQGLQLEAKTLLALVKGSVELLNHDSLILGTPLYVAALQGFDSLVEGLLDAGADINRIGQGNALGSPLMIACAAGHRSIVELLLSRGASQVVEGSCFMSAVETARALRKWSVLEILDRHNDATETDES